MKTKIRICHFVNNVTGKSDGVFEHIKMILRNTDSERFEHLLVFQGGKSIEKEIKNLGIKIFVMPTLKEKITIKSFIQFYLFCKSNRIDIIHTHALKPYSIGGLANVFLKKKLIFNYHGHFINNNYNSKIEQLIYIIIHRLITFIKTVDVAIAPSFNSTKILCHETKLFPQILFYYNGYDHNSDFYCNQYLLKEIGILKNKNFLVAIIARFNFEKRIDIALRIIRNVIDYNPNVVLFLFGDGPLEYEMKKLANNLNINSKTFFHGFIPNVKNYIKYFDLILFTSDREGLPLTLWESMAAGVPVVSTDVGGIKEILEGENCGIVFPQGNIDYGAKRIMELLNDVILRHQMGENGKKAISVNYNINKFRDFFNNLYLDL